MAQSADYAETWISKKAAAELLYLQQVKHNSPNDPTEILAPEERYVYSMPLHRMPALQRSAM